MINEFINFKNDDKINYLNKFEYKKIAVPMTYFCDIHVFKINFHCSKYGEICIGMNKEWGIAMWIQAIHYMNNDSIIFHELDELFKVESNPEENEDAVSKYKDYSLKHVLFIKTLQR